MARSIGSNGHVILSTGAISIDETANLTLNSDYTIFNTTNLTSLSTCIPLIDQQLQNPIVIFTVICMVITNLVIIFGNVLVILSVFLYAKLRTVTNFFIVSLAVADLLLGLSVLPYSLTQTISKAWYFGKIWCMGWLVIDVWLSTASILNLVAISVDRYLAITRPLKYRTMMTAKRAKIIIAICWIVSFLICFPPLVSFSQQGSGLVELNLIQERPRQNLINSEPPQSHPSSSFSSSNLNFKNQHSSNSYLHSSSQTIPNVELNRWSSSFYTNKFFHKSDISQRNKRDRFNEVITSAPLIVDPNLIWSTNQAHKTNEHISRHIILGANFKEQKRTKFKDDVISSTFENNSKYLRKRNLIKDDELDETSSLNCEYQVLQCILFNSKYYVIYSALGSFFIPMLIMIFFYWRIYLVAQSTTKALNRGYISNKSIRTNPLAISMGSKNQIDPLNSVKYGSTNVCNLTGDSNSDSTLRVHRGYIKDQQLNINLTNDLNRRSTNRSSYDSSGRHSSTSTTVTVRANSTIDTTAVQLCRRLLPTRLSNRFLPNNDAKQLRKIQHRSVRCLDRTQNIISLATDPSRSRTSTTLKRTQSEQFIELNSNKTVNDSNNLNKSNKFDKELDKKGLNEENKVNKKDNEKIEMNKSELNNLDKNKQNQDKKETIIKTKSIDSSVRISNSEQNLTAKSQIVIKVSQSSGDLNKDEHPNCPIKLNIVPPIESQTNKTDGLNKSKKLNNQENCYRTNEPNNEINNNYQKNNQNDQIEILDNQNCSNNLTQPITLQVTSSGSTRSKCKSYWSRFSKKRTNPNKTTNQNTNSSEKRRFLAETKAAKTVGVIVGVFWCCWFPFFTVYLTRGLCESKNCIPDIILTLFTWLGYLNSALNPVIYGMFSKDFRRAFKNIVCKCKFSEEAGISTLIRQIHLPNLFEEDMI